MALKDWKKIGKLKWFEEDRSRYLLIYQMTDWNVNIYSRRWGVKDIVKSFKTKFQALKFAKNYMRKY